MSICTLEATISALRFTSLLISSSDLKFVHRFLVVLASSVTKMQCLICFCVILLALGLNLSQLGHLHLHLDPWRRSSSRSSAATSSTIPLVAGRRHHQHRPISPRHNLCAAFKPITAAPSTPASPSASCRPLPRQGWHGLAPPLSLRRRSSRCTMGKSAAEQYP